LGQTESRQVLPSTLGSQKSPLIRCSLFLNFSMVIFVSLRNDFYEEQLEFLQWLWYLPWIIVPKYRTITSILNFLPTPNCVSSSRQDGGRNSLQRRYNHKCILNRPFFLHQTQLNSQITCHLNPNCCLYLR
jgi:hypothetical protein